MPSVEFGKKPVAEPTEVPPSQSSAQGRPGDNQLELLTDRGRNFSEVQEQTPYIDFREAMNVGDYQDMSLDYFTAWSGEVVEGDMSELAGRQFVRVRLEKILPGEDIIVSVGGVKKKVHGSLFYNFGHRVTN